MIYAAFIELLETITAQDSTRRKQLLHPFRGTIQAERQSLFIFASSTYQ